MCFDLLMADQQARNQAKVNRAKYKLRDAKNQRSATESAVQKWGQSLSNKKKLDAAGTNYGVLQENFARRVDARALSSAMGRLAHSEDIGRITAAAASAGIGGSSVEAYNRTVRTGYALQAELSDRAGRSEDYLAASEAGRVMSDAVDSMDNNLYMANLDYSYLGETKGPSAFETLATIGVSAAATALGAPDIGKAITSAKTASIQSNFGIGDGGVAAMGNALEAFKSGVGQVRTALRKPSVPASGGLGGSIYNPPDLSRVGSTGGLGTISNGSLSSVTFR